MGKSLDQYMNEARKYKILSRKEETELAISYSKGDMSAKEKLINANLRFVLKRAHAHICYVNDTSITLQDLVQQGNIGLIIALDKFDINKGYRLISYAVSWIDAKIKDFVLRNASTFKYSSGHDRKLFYRIGKIRELLASGDYDDDARIKWAKKWKVPVVTLKLFERRVMEHTISMDLNNSDDKVNQHDIIGNPSTQFGDVKNNEINNIVSDILSNGLLTEREVDILKSRFMADPPEMLNDIGTRYSLSRERVRQIQNIALKKLNQSLTLNGYNAEALGLA